MVIIIYGLMQYGLMQYGLFPNLYNTYSSITKKDINNMTVLVERTNHAGTARSL